MTRCSRNQRHNDPAAINRLTAPSDLGVSESISPTHLYHSFDEHLSFHTQPGRCSRRLHASIRRLMSPRTPKPSTNLCHPARLLLDAPDIRVNSKGHVAREVVRHLQAQR
jgi:hypothetical protein